MTISEQIKRAKTDYDEVYHAGQLDIISNAEALKGSASGSSVTIKDISPVEHNVSCIVEGKNLLNAMEIADYNASTDYVKDVENNAFTLRGNEGGQYLAGSGQLMLPYTNTENITQKGVKVKGGVKYTISFDLLIIEQGIYNSNISLIIYTSVLGTIPAGIVEGTLGTTVRRSITFTPTADDSISFCFRINNNYVTISNIQVEVGTTATDFTPYIYLGNLITQPYPFVAEGYKTPNATIDVANDGTITIDNNYTNGLGPLYITKNLVLPAGTYTLSGWAVEENTYEGVDNISNGMFSETIGVYKSDVYANEGSPSTDTIGTVQIIEETPTGFIKNLTFTLTEETPIYIVYLYGSAPTGASGVPTRVITKLKPTLVSETSQVTVKRLGKNLCNTGTATFTRGITIELPTPIPANTSSAFSGIFETDYTGKSNLIQFRFTDGTGNTDAEAVSWSTQKPTERQSFVRTFSKPLKSIVFYAGPNWSSSAGLTGTLTNVQLEIGSTATEYEPYIEPTEYTATADGIVEGVRSLYPNMTLMTDTEGVTISAEYIKDIDKAFEAVTTAVALTGGE